MAFIFNNVFILVTIISVCGGQPSASSTTRLYSALMNGYQKYVRPGLDYMEPVLVEVKFNMAAIRTFNEITSRFSVCGFFTIKWTDERLIWNPSLFNGTDSILLPQKSIWIPHLMLVNPFENLKMLGFDDVIMRAFPDGHVVWTVAGVFDSVCDPDVTYFPFDKHECRLAFIPWGYSPKEVEIETPTKTFDLSFFLTNPLWNLESTNMSVQFHQFLNMMSLNVVFTRRPDYFIVNVILPLTFICFINLFVFLLPADSGERVGFSITVLLAIAVFMTILSDTLPKNSKPNIPIICYLLLLQMVISVVIMACTIFSLRFYTRDDSRKPVPKWVVSMVICCKCNKRKKKVCNSSLTARMDNYNHAQLPNKDVKRRDQGDLKLEDMDMIKIAGDDIPTGELFYDRITWRDVGHVFDGICLFVFCILITVASVTFLVYLATTGKVNILTG